VCVINRGVCQFAGWRQSRSYIQNIPLNQTSGHSVFYSGKLWLWVIPVFSYIVYMLLMLHSFGLVTSCLPVVNYLYLQFHENWASQHPKAQRKMAKVGVAHKMLTYASWTTLCKDAACLMHNSLLHINRDHVTNYTWNCTILQKLLSFVCVVGHLYRCS